ncbi:AAA family ATPase [Streptomyces mutabilis]|uniref:AAA family ATPase n=1 Tax=Streptomyces mutabilis TaxID=67332 RepID=UPI0035EE39E2
MGPGQQITLVGDGKAGKSLFTQEWMWRMATGQPFLGDDPQAPLPILYLDAENGQEQVQERFLSFGAGPLNMGELRYASFPPIRPLDTAGGGADLIALVKATGAQLVVIDTVSRFISGPENDADTWLNLYRHTLLPLKRDRISSVRLDHFGKDKERGGRGSSAKTQDVDHVWELSAPRRRRPLPQAHPHPHRHRPRPVHPAPPSPTRRRQLEARRHPPRPDDLRERARHPLRHGRDPRHRGTHHRDPRPGRRTQRRGQPRSPGEARRARSARRQQQDRGGRPNPQSQVRYAQFRRFPGTFPGPFPDHVSRKRFPERTPERRNRRSNVSRKRRGNTRNAPPFPTFPPRRGGTGRERRTQSTAQTPSAPSATSPSPATDETAATTPTSDATPKPEATQTNPTTPPERGHPVTTHHAQYTH